MKNKFSISFLAFSTFLLLLSGIFISGCDGKHEKPTFEYMPDMMDQPSIRPQREYMPPPVTDTWPRGYTPYPYTVDQGDLAGANLQNPLPMTMDNLKKGQKIFNTYCIVCHGPTAKGNGFIVPKFPSPPSLNSDKVRNWTDGRIYHVITLGQNLMPSYAGQIQPNDRWAVIHYLRAIQHATAPTPDDVEAFKKALQDNTLP
jgi:mono/diheme cytochrome c family protein